MTLSNLINVLVVQNSPSGHILVPITPDISFPICEYYERGKGRIWVEVQEKEDRQKERERESALAASSDIISMDVTGGMLSLQSL